MPSPKCIVKPYSNYGNMVLKDDKWTFDHACCQFKANRRAGAAVTDEEQHFPDVEMLLAGSSLSTLTTCSTPAFFFLSLGSFDFVLVLEGQV